MKVKNSSYDCQESIHKFFLLESFTLILERQREESELYIIFPFSTFTILAFSMIAMFSSRRSNPSG